jgi:DNA mismatch repair protein MutL
VFVNRRPIENRGVNFALLEGYHTSLMKARYPVCCLFLEIDPAAVDVNIHPSKREVKFHREMEIRRHVAQAVRGALLEFHGGNADARPAAMPARAPAPAPRTDTIAAEPPSDFPGFVPTLLQSKPGPRTEQPALKMGFGYSTVRPSATPETITPQTSRETGTTTPVVNAQPPSFTAPPIASAPLLNVPLRLVGVIGRLYVVLESDRGLVLLDQHAAHERILFEQMLDRLERRQQSPSQKLLLPETIELPPRDAQFLREQLSTLTRLGVGLSEFGERTFLLDGLPPFVKVGNSRRFVIDLVDELKSAGRDVNTARLGEHVVAKTVCRHAVKANDPLRGAELEHLVEDLRRCAMPYTCPHGRPTLIEMNFRELEKKFGRTQ